MKLTLIAAMDEERGIGKDNQLPLWNAPGDLKRFKALTTSKVVIMGRRTFESIRDATPAGKEILPERLKIVVSTTMEPDEHKVLVVDTLEFAIHFAKSMIKKFNMLDDIMIIGGGRLYQAALPIASTLQLTMIKGIYKCDTFFPEFQKLKKWVLSSSEEFETHSFHTYDRDSSDSNEPQPTEPTPISPSTIGEAIKEPT